MIPRITLSYLNSELGLPGSAIYLYGIVKNSTCLWFFVDDVPHGTFTHSPSVANTFEYNVMLFSVDSLSHEPHVFMVQNRDVNNNISLLLLDYLIYTTSVRSSSQKNPRLTPVYYSKHTPATTTTSTTTAVITVTATSETSRAVLSLAIVFGTLLATIAVVEGVLWFCIHRRRNRAGRTSATFGPDTTANCGFQKGYWNRRRGTLGS